MAITSGKVLLIHFDSVANLYFWQAEDQTSLILILILSWKLGSSYPKLCILLSYEKNVTVQFHLDNVCQCQGFLSIGSPDGLCFLRRLE